MPSYTPPPAARDAQDGPPPASVPRPERALRLRVLGLTSVGALVAAAATAGVVYAQGATPSSARTGASAHRLLPAHPADPANWTVECEGTATGTFKPSVTSAPTSIHGTVTDGKLTDCRLSAAAKNNAKIKDIKSGSFTVTADGTASCNGPVSGTGSATITWYSGVDQTGTVLGTTVVNPSGTQTGQSDADEDQFTGEFNGTVPLTGGSLLAGQSVTAFGVPDRDTANAATVEACSKSGLAGASGSGQITFAGLLL